MKFDMSLKSPLLKRPRRVKMTTVMVDCSPGSHASFFASFTTFTTAMGKPNQPKGMECLNIPDMPICCHEPHATVTPNLNPSVIYTTPLTAAPPSDTNQNMPASQSHASGPSIENTLQMIILVIHIFSLLLSQLDITTLSEAFRECMARRQQNSQFVTHTPCIVSNPSTPCMIVTLHGNGISNPLRLKLLEEREVASSTEVVKVGRRSWKGEARQGGHSRVDKIGDASSILGKRDGEKESQYEDSLLVHVDKRAKDMEAIDMEVSSTNALSVETAMKQLRRAQ